MILGKSGTGKSTSLRNLSPNDADIASVTGKEFPFKTSIKPTRVNGYEEVAKFIKGSTKPIVVIDDVNYLMSFEEMARVKETGYGKFSEMAKNFYSFVRYLIDRPTEQTFYLLAHSEDNDEGQLRLKTTGKMLSEKIVLEGLTNIVLQAGFTDGEFVFYTKTDGKGVKSPMGMFEGDHISNDLKLVDQAIREYYKDTPVAKTPVKNEPIDPSVDSPVKAPTKAQTDALSAMKYTGKAPESFEEAKAILIGLQKNGKK